ncbi:MAG: secretin N-terminal domain-containing protein [Sedimentisphaerales bacterium]
MGRIENSHDKMKIPEIVFIWSFVLIMAATTAGADGGAADASAGSAPKIIDKFEVEEDFGVRKALAMLGSQCHKNIVPSPSVTGSLAFRRLTNVTFEEAMDAILGDNALYEEQGNIIKVYTKEEYKKIMEDPARMIHKVFTLYYITAEEAQNLIQPVLSKNAQVQISSPAEKDISGGTSGGTSGSSGTGGGFGTSSGGGGDSMAQHDTIVVYDFPERIAQVEQVLKSLDAKPDQVLVEATILSARLTENMDLGIDWNFMGGSELDGYPAIDNSVGAPVEITGFASLEDGLRVGIQSGDVFAFINALETVTDVTVLANPKILALNKQEGQVLIGQNLGYRSSTTIGQGGVATEGEVQFLQTGTMLVFRPYIGNDGYVRMEIYPKDSSGTIGTDGVPTETTTQLRTNILLRDGQTVVIGGLFRDVVTTERSQVPLLGDIPIIGMAFRGTTDTTERQEVMIMLTPHIITEPNQTNGIARKDDVERKRFGAKEELQPVGRGRMAEDHYAAAMRYYNNGQLAEAMTEVKSALNLRPTYLEALRLKERIIAETEGREALDRLERKMSENQDDQEAPNWHRR